ncbi:hypothetical protein OIDMADRAFT_61450 [Oidiodendron maius Zn]|uniref:Uncharacterized protein n=1 Tax=Oidiodendron maius (strain Zn) TaxID=913774 RepID=A0A0C3GST9_OIDMZ|nr:hypothetical protein OIDMADRAFT_61450 [Oidiodendron maius Zn]
MDTDLGDLSQFDAFFEDPIDGLADAEAFGPTYIDPMPTVGGESSDTAIVEFPTSVTEAGERATSTSVPGAENEQVLPEMAPGSPNTNSEEASRPVRGSSSRGSSIDRSSETSTAQETDTTRSTSPSDTEHRKRDSDVGHNSSNSLGKSRKRKRPRHSDQVVAGTSPAKAILIEDNSPRKRNKRKAAENAQRTWQKYKKNDSLWMDEVLNMARQMREVNEDQATNLKSVTDEISGMLEGLSKLSRHVSRMLKEKDRQKTYLTNLETYMEQWGAKEEDATRQLQQIGIRK